MIDLIGSAISSLNIQDCGDRSMCERRPCRNSATCVDVSPTEYKCMCAAGFAGKDCSQQVTICDTDDPCQNGAGCVALADGGYRCNCPLGFMGPSCEAAVQLGRELEFRGNGYVEYNNNVFVHARNNVEEVVEITFRTSEPEGLLFWQGSPSDPLNHDYFYLTLIDGYLEYSYELGSGPMVARSPMKVDDGFVHTARLTRRGQYGTFQIDDQQPARVQSSGRLQVLNTPGSVFLGGVPNLEVYTGNKFKKNFSGCVTKLEIKGREITVAEQAQGGINVRPCLGY
ncbi:basement membrane-specific heparan sulfate proteoglycan core protein [Elysia marginata]|uniref:Basement membrane-specific heparan sulfate proteoglycan core protein n=1 Tax=Elysia marginata TaxID=1093978 RepID=A0AAV4JJJ5_9GAST|nr:basement membrane-specific heparan sulfate proteoglycan core protein [Elysia marginata]